MVIFGTSLLAVCALTGLVVGRLLGWALGMEANVGGVGIAMILLILLSDRLREAGKFGTNSANGVMFWSSLYIPVVVAMASSQNVLGALTGGPAAILAGILAVAVCMALVPAISRLGGGKSDQDDWK